MFLEKFKVEGRRAFVTGAAGGIGLASAEALLEAGAEVIISDIDEKAVRKTQECLKDKGLKTEAEVLDVTDPKACTSAAERMTKDFGPIDILVANAGVAMEDTAAEDMSDKDWNKVIDINLNGVFWTCRAFGKLMLKHGKGSIVTTGSMSGFISNIPQRQVHYNTSKAAVHHMTRSLAGEWATKGVRVNSVAPTYVETDLVEEMTEDRELFETWMRMTPMHRMIQPEEVASLVLFLASDASSGMTGSIVKVDAGYTIW